MILDQLKFEISVIMTEYNLTPHCTINGFHQKLLEKFDKNYSYDEIENMLVLIEQEQSIPDFDNMELPRFLF